MSDREKIRPDLPLVIPGMWVTDGACAGEDPELWWNDPREIERNTRALAICRTCPVIDKCRDWAIRNHEVDGIWGGTTPEERREARDGGTVTRAQRVAVANREQQALQMWKEGVPRKEIAAALEVTPDSASRILRRARKAAGMVPTLPGRIVVGAAHGTASGYNTAGCKCPDCRAWMTATRRAHRERTREAETA